MSVGGSGRADLLIEIGCEEIPARMLEGASADFEAIVARVLSEGALAFEAPRRFATPRRLAVLFPSVQLRQEDREEELTGPPVKAAYGPEGQPTKAAHAFAQKAGVAVGALAVVTTPKGEYLSARRCVAGRGAGEVLASGLPAPVAAMSFPKSMRWGDGKRRFVRPVHWVVALLGEEIVPVELLGIRAGRTSAGHRAIGARAIELRRPADYEPALGEQGIVADRAARRARLGQRMAELAASAGVELVADEHLAEEVADLVEHPGAVVGSFSADFLDLPPAVLTTTLRHHQKAFSTVANGALSNHFLSVADRRDDPEGHIRSGNEWVVSGRLEDARFFYREDMKVPFASRLERLETVTFHAKAGSYREKTERVRRIAGALARIAEEKSRVVPAKAGTQRVGGPAVDLGALDEAARLAKCDLTTGLVGEFPELQGIAGGIYIARQSTEALVVPAKAGTQPAPLAATLIAAAVADHYRPSGAGDDLPRTIEGRLLALADKLDTLAVLGTALGLPTGSRDPFGLRRAGSGIVRITAEAPLPLSFHDLINSIETKGSDLFEFLTERFKHWLKEHERASYDTINAVLLAADGTRWVSEPVPRVARKVLELESRRELPEIAALIEMHKRCRNIISKAEAEGDFEVGEIHPISVQRDFAGTEPEKQAYAALMESVRSMETQVHALLERDEFGNALDRLVEIYLPLKSYFEHVLVMHADRETRVQRLGPLRTTSLLIEQVADLKQISISREEMQERLGRLAGPQS